MSCGEPKFNRYLRDFPRVYKLGQNPVITALFKAFTSSDDEVCRQIQNTKAQLFVRTAEGQNLDRLANSLGVSRPVELGLDDKTFQELIPNLSLKAKQVRKAFYDTADVFWGPLFSRANLESLNIAPFSVSEGEFIEVSVNGQASQKVFIVAGDLAVNGTATAEEMAAILSKLDGVTVSIIEDSLTGNETINIRTDSPGPRGSIQVIGGTMVGATGIDFSTVKRELRDQDQRVQIFEINENEVIVEIPAVVPALRRTLKGSHHFHADSTLQGPVAPENGIWQGSFFFDPDGTETSITVTGENAQLSQPIFKNQILTSITVDDTVKITEPTGFLVFGYGTDHQESVVRYRGVPNSNTVLIDPSHVFQQDHPIGTFINVVSETSAYRPDRDGSDLAIYMTSPSGAREAVEEILRSLAAAGVIVNFIVLAPTYKYLIDNPYISDDDAPSCD